MKEDNIKTYNNRNGGSIETPSFNLNEKNIFSQIDTPNPVTKTKLEAHEFKPVDKETHKAVVRKIENLKLDEVVNKDDGIEFFEITPMSGQGEKTHVAEVGSTEEPITYQRIYKKIEPVRGTVNKVENNTLSGKIESISAKRFTGENFPEINKNNEFVTANVSQKQQIANLETVKAKVSDYKDGIEFFETTPMSGQGEKTHVAEVGSTEEPITYQRIYKKIEPISGTVNKVENNTLSGKIESISAKRFTGENFPEINKNNEFVTRDLSQKEGFISITDNKSDFFAETEYVAPVLGPTENQNIESITDTIEYTAEAEYVAPVLGPTENQNFEINTDTTESTSPEEAIAENTESVENLEVSNDETNAEITENTSTEEATAENTESVENPEVSNDETNTDTTENTSTEEATAENTESVENLEVSNDETNADTTESTSPEEATAENTESVENLEVSNDETNAEITENTSTETNEKEIAEIVIGEKPKKLKYAQNKEYLDLSGATIFVVYADGTVEEKEISFDEVSVVGFDNTTVGKQTITLVYEGKTIDLEIEIVKAQATQSSLPSRNYNPEPEIYIDPASLLFSIEKLKRITNGGESSLQYVSQKINGIKIEPAIKKELSNLIDYSFIDTAKSDIAKMASSGDKNTSTPLSILNGLEGLKKDLLEDDPSLQSTFDLLLFANLEEFGSDMSATEKALFAEEKLESILDDYDSQISDAKTNWQEGQISYQEYLDIIKPLNETKHALEQQFDSYVFNSTLELINKPNRTAEENEVLDNWYNSVTSDRFVCWDENNRESKDLYINYLNDAELYTYALISQQYATNASIEYNLPDNANEELNRLLSELNKAEEELNRSTEKYDNYSNNRFMSLYDPNYKAICDEKQETVNQAQANYDSLKRQVEDLQNSISIVSNYMEDSLYSYEILIKGIPVAERTNEQKDFLVQRQQTALSNSMNRASQEYNNYATELSEKQQRIEEIEAERAVALQIDMYNGANYIQSNNYQSVCQATEEEYNALLASEKELLTNVSMWNNAIGSIQTANINLFKNYSDFDDNILSNITSYELKEESYWQDGVECYNTYAVFYDKDGNEVDASQQEIAMYMCENNINLNKSTMNNYGLHDAMEYLNNLNYLKNYSGEGQNNLDINTLAYIMNTQSSDTFNSYFNTFNNQSIQLQGFEDFNNRLAKLQENDIDTDGDGIVDVTVGGVSDSLKLIGFGLKDGWNNFFNGFSNLVYGDGQVSAKEYSSMYLMDYINNTYDASTVASAAYEISNSIGNMAPSIIASVIPVVGQALSVSLMGISSMGNSKEQALQMGMSEGQATLYGFLSGASEAALGYLLGSIPGLSNMAKFEGMHGLTGFLAKGGSEVVEEMTQEMLNPVFECIATGSKFTFDQIDMDAVLKAGVYAFITSGVMNGGSLAIDTISKSLTGDYTALSQVGSNYISSLLNGQISLPDAISNFSSDLSTLTRSKATLTELISNLHSNPDFVAAVESYKTILENNGDVFGKNAGNTTVDDVISKVAVSSILEISRANNFNQAIVDGLKSQQSTLTTEMAELQEKINELESAVLDGSIDDATRVSKQTELNNLIGQFENKQIELSQISDLLENPNAVISSINPIDMASKIMQTNFIGSAQAAINAKKASEMKQNLEQLFGRKETLEKSIKTVEEKITKVSKELESQSDGLNKHRNKYLQQLSNQLRSLTSELETINNRIEKLSDELEGTKNDIIKETISKLVEEALGETPDEEDLVISTDSVENSVSGEESASNLDEIVDLGEVDSVSTKTEAVLTEEQDSKTSQYPKEININNQTFAITSKIIEFATKNGYETSEIETAVIIYNLIENAKKAEIEKQNNNKDYNPIDETKISTAVINYFKNKNFSNEHMIKYSEEFLEPKYYKFSSKTSTGLNSVTFEPSWPVFDGLVQDSSVEGGTIHSALKNIIAGFDKNRKLTIMANNNSFTLKIPLSSVIGKDGGVLCRDSNGEPIIKIRKANKDEIFKIFPDFKDGQIKTSGTNFTSIYTEITDLSLPAAKVEPVIQGTDKPIYVKVNADNVYIMEGKAAAWFSSEGGGTQYKFFTVEDGYMVLKNRTDITKILKDNNCNLTGEITIDQILKLLFTENENSFASKLAEQWTVDARKWCVDGDKGTIFDYDFADDQVSSANQKNDRTDGILEEAEAKLLALEQARTEYDQTISKVKAELESISPKLVELYEQGKISSNDLAFFLGFEEHNFLHVSRVAEESLDIVNKLNERIANGNFEGLGSIDADIVYKSGLAHDLGMSSGGYVLCKIDGKLQLKSIEELLSKNEAGKYIYEEQIKPFLINGKFEGDIEGIVVRKMHPLNSAIQVLQNRDMFGTDTEMVAVLALIHSKSTSGVKNVTSNEQLIEMLNKLELASETLEIEFDMSKFMEIDAEGNRVLREDVANSLRTGAIALRVGDAHAQKTGFNHSGDKISVDEVIPLSEIEITDILNEYDATHTISIGEIAAAEAAKAKVSIISETGTQTILEGKTTGNDYDFSRQIVLGEKNSIALPVEVTEDTIRYTIEVLSENTPACTWLNSIQEKFGEYATFGDINQEVIIKLPSNVSEQVIKLYEAFAKSYFETGKANNIASITFRVEGTDIIKSIDNPNKIQIIETNTETSTQVVESEGVQEVVDLGTEYSSMDLVLKINETIKSLETSPEATTKMIEELGKYTIEQIDAIIAARDSIDTTTPIGYFVKTAMDIYEQGLNNAIKDYSAFYKNFRDHGFKHALEVTKYALKLGQNLKLSQEEMSLIAYASLSHDFGMQGGYVHISGKVFDSIKNAIKKKKNELSEEELTKYKQLLEENKGKVLSIEQARDIFKSDLMEDADFIMNFARTSHPLNSALDILIIQKAVSPEVQTYYENKLKEIGYTGDTKNIGITLAAILAMSHSKSTSGITLFTEISQWEGCISTLKETLSYRLEQTQSQESVEDLFNEEALMALLKNPNMFAEIQDYALLVRDGDALSKVVSPGTNQTIMQNGQVTTITSIPKLDILIDPETKKFKVNSEESAATIEKSLIQEEFTSGEKVENTFSKGIHAGELNVQYTSTVQKLDTRKIYEAFIKVNDSSAVPHSTTEHGILERLGEIVTYTNMDSRTVTILVAQGTDSRVIDLYKSEIEAFKEKMLENLEKQFLGRLDTDEYKNLRKKQENFFENITILEVSSNTSYTSLNLETQSFSEVKSTISNELKVKAADGMKDVMEKFNHVEDQNIIEKAIYGLLRAGVPYEDVITSIDKLQIIYNISSDIFNDNQSLSIDDKNKIIELIAKKYANTPNDLIKQHSKEFTKGDIKSYYKINIPNAPVGKTESGLTGARYILDEIQFEPKWPPFDGLVQDPSVADGNGTIYGALNNIVAQLAASKNPLRLDVKGNNFYLYIPLDKIMERQGVFCVDKNGDPLITMKKVEPGEVYKIFPDFQYGMIRNTGTNFTSIETDISDLGLPFEKTENFKTGKVKPIYVKTKEKAIHVETTEGKVEKKVEIYSMQGTAAACFSSNGGGPQFKFFEVVEIDGEKFVRVKKRQDISEKINKNIEEGTVKGEKIDKNSKKDEKESIRTYTIVPNPDSDSKDLIQDLLFSGDNTQWTVDAKAWSSDIFTYYFEDGQVASINQKQNRDTSIASEITK